MKVYVGDKFVDKDDAVISVFDHGLLYGDGVFEGIRLYDGCVFKLDEHLERLEYSAKAILLQLPWKREELAEIICEACRLNNLESGYIRVVVTRGAGTLGLNPKLCSNPQLIVIADNIQLYPEEFYTEGLKIITVPTRRSNPAATPPMVKSLNYLNNIMAKIEAVNSGFVEALMLNDQGNVAECTGDNVFIIHKGSLITPPTNAGALKGITRQFVLNIAEEINVPVVETDITRYDIWTADECFLTGTAAELIPVIEVDARPIGTGTPGDVTQKFLEVFRKKVKSDGAMIR